LISITAECYSHIDATAERALPTLSRLQQVDHAMTDVLVADDTLYEELYDVRREAQDSGNLVEQDMNPAIGALRERGGVQKGFLRALLGLPWYNRHVMAHGRAGYTTLSWDACNIAFRDHERFSSHIMHHPNPGDEKVLGILEMDEPEHRAYRATLQPLFVKPRTLTWWRERWINEIVDTLIGNLARRDRAELNLQLCARVPVHTITRAIGMKGDDALVFRTALLKCNAHGRVSPEDQAAARRTVDSMLETVIAKRRVAPEDDLISHLVQAKLELDGETRPLTDREILINVKLVMLAGGGTSWRQMGITIWALLTHLDQFEAVKADRKLIDDAIEESVRWNPTDPVFSRLAVCDTEILGLPIPEGAAVEICLAAANRDPARWDNPDAYDLHRPLQPHMGFGLGTHQCLGMNVARSEINVAINKLMDAFPALRLDPDAPAPFLTGGLEQRGMSGLHVLLR
jgi:cytochrome P450